MQNTAISALLQTNWFQYYYYNNYEQDYRNKYTIRLDKCPFFNKCIQDYHKNTQCLDKSVKPKLTQSTKQDISSDR